MFERKREREKLFSSVTKDFDLVVLNEARESEFLETILIILMYSEICRATVIIINTVQISLPYLVVLKEVHGNYC